MTILQKQLKNYYLQYLNDFLTVSVFAEYHGISIQFAEYLIVEGKKHHELNLY